MPDIVRAPIIASVALSRVMWAKLCVEKSSPAIPSYSATEVEAMRQAQSALNTAAELLALIAEPADAEATQPVGQTFVVGPVTIVSDDVEA